MKHISTNHTNSISRKYLLTLCIILLWMCSAKERRKERIAVCVTGHISRWFPDQHLTNLATNNPHYSFSFFFNFETHSKFSLPSSVSSTEFITSLTNETLAVSVQEITAMYSQHNSELANLRFSVPYGNASWYRHLRLTSNQPLNRIDSLAHDGGDVRILNLYRLQHGCVYDIMAKEKERHDHTLQAYDYVIFTREDLIYFQPFNLTTALDKLRNEPDHLTETTEIAVPMCNVVTKGCLEGKGMNMKMQIMRRKEGLHLFSSRQRFYRSLFEKSIKIESPERFELIQLEMMNYHKCTLPVEVMGVASALQSNNPFGYCFPESELQDFDTHDLCVPTHFLESSKNRKCSDFEMMDPDEAMPQESSSQGPPRASRRNKGPSQDNLKLSKAMSSWQTGVSEIVDRKDVEIMLKSVKKFFRSRSGVEDSPKACP